MKVEGKDELDQPTESNEPTVGYCRPPVHTRFRPGQSGNPGGRAKGSQNLKTIFRKIMKEEVSLREGSHTRMVTKAEAIMRGLIIGALKGDHRSAASVFRLAEQTGEFDEGDSGTGIRRLIIQWEGSDQGDGEAKP